MNFEMDGKQYELITLNVAGSRLYGNATAESDWDYRGVYIAKNSDKFGLFPVEEQLGGQPDNASGKGSRGSDVYKALIKAGLKLEETDDIIIYEIKRFIELAVKQNPNIMDILCHNYEGISNIYVNEKGKNLLDNKELFISKRLKYTFADYGMSQFSKIKNHNKWINKFPDSTDAKNFILGYYYESLINKQFIIDNFGSTFMTSLNLDDNNATISISWEVFQKNAVIDIANFRLPQMIDFITCFDLKAKRIKIDNTLALINKDSSLDDMTTIRELLTSTGSFRSLGGDKFNLFTTGNGVFDGAGNLKRNPQKEVGNFVCTVIIDKNEYKKQTDSIKNMWNWKNHRNESRGKLEDKFGFDTKHASHLIRLLSNAINILKFSKYSPELEGLDLKLVKDIRAGKYDYEWIVKYTETTQELLEIAYSESDMQEKPNTYMINLLLLYFQDM